MLGAMVIVVAALVVSFLCSLLEACLLSLSRAEIGAMSDRRLAGIWRGLRTDLERPLAVILIMNTCALTIGTSLSAGQIAERYGERGVLIFSIALSFAIVQWAEILPKTLGARHRRAVAAVFGGLLRTCVVVLAPLTWLVRVLNRPLQGRHRAEPPTTADELRALTHDARSSRAIEPHQSDIIDRAVGLARVKAKDILIPRQEMSVLSTAMSIEAAFIFAHIDAHTRYPLCQDGDLDAVVGYVNLKELVAALHVNPAQATLIGIARPIDRIDAGASASDILRRFVDEHLHLAIVRDGHDKTLGMITIEDLIEQLVGDIEDEFDVLPKRVHDLGGNVLMVGGGANVSKVLGGGSGEDAAATVAACIQRRLGRAPKPGDAVDVDGARLVVRRIRRGRVFEAVVETTPSRAARGSP